MHSLISRAVSAQLRLIVNLPSYLLSRDMGVLLLTHSTGTTSRECVDTSKQSALRNAHGKSVFPHIHYVSLTMKRLEYSYRLKHSFSPHLSLPSHQYLGGFTRCLLPFGASSRLQPSFNYTLDRAGSCANAPLMETDEANFSFLPRLGPDEGARLYRESINASRSPV